MTRRVIHGKQKIDFVDLGGVLRRGHAEPYDGFQGGDIAREPCAHHERAKHNGRRARKGLEQGNATLRERLRTVQALLEAKMDASVLFDHSRHETNAMTAKRLLAVMARSSQTQTSMASANGVRCA